ncbi:MAG: cytidine deaminase [Clostridia bacterium]|nr:cytidine deaminase [Clostridia bacterium]
MTDLELMQLAVEAREMAYAPYSNFRVGAALLAKSGKVYKGCNIENAAYSPTNCAERTALFKAVSEGEREFVAIAIVGGMYESIADFCAPCGVCRQALAEFCGKDFRVILGNPDNVKAYTFGEILPFAFGKADLE